MSDAKPTPERLVAARARKLQLANDALAHLYLDRAKVVSAMAEVANQNADAIGVSRWRSCMSRGTASTVVIAALQRAIDSILPRWPSGRHRPIVVISVRNLVEAGLLPVSALALWR